MTEAIDGIAIVGMAAVFPGARNVRAFWDNIVAAHDAIREVPPSRWPIADHYRAAASEPDQFYCRRGGFIDDVAYFDPLAFGVMPNTVASVEPDQLLALEVAAAALADAWIDEAHLPHDKASVILGRGGYTTPGQARLQQHVRAIPQLIASLHELLPELDASQLAGVAASLRSRLPAYGPDSAIGLVPNLAASRVANRLDFRGSAYTIDAACASSLVAIDHACRELREQRSDLVLAGGCHVCHDLGFWSVFTQLGALSRSETIRPFDRRADGLLIGEGLGMVVLKRAADALRDGNRIYAVIRGTAVASDGRGASLMQPHVEGQVRALEQAWAQARLDPTQIGLLEAHGTATAAGDTAELATLARVFAAADSHRPRAVIGSVKSMIGHTMPAAGVAGLIKAAWAVSEGVLPPTLHCEQPRTQLEHTRFRVTSSAESWPDDLPRIAAVNAFGFGGINAHVVLEAARTPHSRRRPIARGTAMLHVRGIDATNILAQLDARETSRGIEAGLVVLDPTPERIARARAIVARGLAWRGRNDIWFSPQALARTHAKLAFVFPGVDAAFRPNIDDVAEYFALPRPTHARPRSLEELGMGVVEVNRLCNEALTRMGIHPDIVAGHSVGEWTAMMAAGVLERAEVERFMAGLTAGSLEVPGVVFAAVGADAQRIRELVADLDDVSVAIDNCPHQVIVCGSEVNIAALGNRCRDAKIFCQQLPFRSGFHSPLFRDFLAPIHALTRSMRFCSARIPLWSATTCSAFPSDEASIRKLVHDHLVEPVRFRELVEQMYAAGVRIFIEAGHGRLSGFIEDTLRGKPHLVIAANVADKPGMQQLRRVVAALACEGIALDGDDLDLRMISEHPPRGNLLDLGTPTLHGLEPLSPANSDPGRPLRATTTNSGLDHPVVQLFESGLRELDAARREVLDAWRKREIPTITAAPTIAHAPASSPASPSDPAATPRAWGAAKHTRFVREMSLAAYPELIDHALYRQPRDWPHVDDLYPVVPMTMLIELMTDFACEFVPGAKAIKVENVGAVRWMAVSPPVELGVKLAFDGIDRVDVVFEGYARGSVRLAAVEPTWAPFVARGLTRPGPSDVDAEGMYRDRWMFHGPEYQAVRSITKMADDGIEGELEMIPAKGGLLDNAGQLLGFWVMQKTKVDQLAMPVRIESIERLCAAPPLGTRIHCSVHVSTLSERDVRADIELGFDGRAWMRIRGWEDRRFDTTSMDVLRFPERLVLSELRPDGYYWLREPWRTSPSRDLMARRYLDAREREEYEACAAASKSSWLLGRVVVKDAVRHALWQRGHGALFPIEITVENDAAGAPHVRGPFDGPVHVSLAHKGGAAVAIVAWDGPVGIDLERIEPRPESFAEVAFTPSERGLVHDQDPSEAWTRMWSAKESVAKARGTGLEGRPSQFPITAYTPDKLRVADRWVHARREDEFIITWTHHER